jgi:hypothetical protein
MQGLSRVYPAEIGALYGKRNETRHILPGCNRAFGKNALPGH